MSERLHKTIAALGFCSRRAAEELIKQGRVTVNGETAHVGDNVLPGDIVAVDGKPLRPQAGQHTYIMLHKPRGYVTTMKDDRGRKTVAQLVADLPVRVFPVGRLDMYSEGLLLMTDDGELANRLTHPSHGVKKTYLVRVRGQDIPGAAKLMEKPLKIDGRATRPADIKILKQDEEGTALLSVTISEGRNRQVRRLCENSGLQVLRLKRVEEAGLSLGKLPPGKWRHLSLEEVSKLQK